VQLLDLAAGSGGWIWRLWEQPKLPAELEEKAMVPTKLPAKKLPAEQPAKLPSLWVHPNVPPKLQTTLQTKLPCLSVPPKVPPKLPTTLQTKLPPTMPTKLPAKRQCRQLAEQTALWVQPKTPAKLPTVRLQQTLLA
jgi:hypothetical protein